MIRRIPLVGSLIVCLVVCVSISSPVTAAEKTAAELLPNTVAIYAELPQAKQLLATVLDHPLRPKLEALDDYRKAYQSPQYAQLQIGVAIVEQKLGMKWRPAIEALTDGGIYFAVDVKTQGAITLVKAKDAAMLEKFRDTIIQLARDDAAAKGNPDPVKSVDYRGHMAYQIGEGRFATLGSWLVLTNKGETGKALLDAYVDGNPQSLASDEAFITARKTISGQPTIWSFVRLNVLRDAGIAKELFAGKTDNPAAELLVGGIMATLQKTPYATASLDASKERLALSLSVPFESSWVDSTRHFYFGPDGNSPAPRLLSTKDTLLSLSTYRDLAGLWAASADLFNEQVNAQIAQANSGLSPLFSGKDFGTDVLGSVRPEIQLVVARQTFAADTPTPSIKLPALAFAFRLKEPDKMQRQWKVTFQSLLGFLNVLGAMQGQPQLEMNNEKVDGVLLVTGAYLPKDGDAPDKATAITYNLAPTAAFVNDLFIVSSSRQLALDLGKAAQQPAENPTASTTNTHLLLNVAPIREALADNVSHLVSQNMLEKGHDKAHAEKEISALLAVLGVLRDASLKLTSEAKTLRLELDVRLAAEAAGGTK